MTRRKYISILVILVAVAMVLSSAAFLFPGGNQTTSSSAQGSNATANVATQGAVNVGNSVSQKGMGVLNALHSKNIPNKDIYLPNFNAVTPKVGSLIDGPSYTTAPAPMGIGTYGFSNNSGVITRNNISTNSFEGSVTFNNFKTFYALDDGPNSVTIQLNDILNNVTLFGNSNYTFWNQNVLFYSARTQQITFLDNIWNFSSPAFYMSPNVFSSDQGNLIAPYFYYTVGPTYSVTFPFTVNLYTNATVMNGDNTVFFNYTVSDSSGSISGTYDVVQFNSTYGQPAGYSAPQANYYVTSYGLTPTTFIPYDAEIMIGGPGGGSTALINDINATMTLKYNKGGNMVNVPNAWDVGSETGETSTGAAVTWTPNGVAHLSAGPSFVYGMWNVSQTNTFNHYSGTVNPPNSFMFVSPGSSFNAASSTWTPLTQSGSYSFNLPAGSYASSILLADHTPIASADLSSGSIQNFNLPLNMTTGVYTPLYAYGNAQLKYISQFGTGTVKNPYVLMNNPSQTGMLDPLFNTFNDYTFPQFNGILLHSTTAHVVVSNMPNFEVQYSPLQQYILSFYLGVNFATNQLGYVLYNTQNVVVTHNTISGWFTNYLSEFPAANLLLWNSHKNVIADNHFVTMDSSLMIYNAQHGSPGNNMVYGNYFTQDRSLNSTNFPGIFVYTTFGTSPYGPVAMTIYSSGNTITHNSVFVYNTAISPFYSIYSGNYATYSNNWNGNFWWNYVFTFGGYHSFKQGIYTNSGQIANGGDSHPMGFLGSTPDSVTSWMDNFLNP